jgi:hypothetical protein
MPNDKIVVSAAMPLMIGTLPDLRHLYPHNMPNRDLLAECQIAYTATSARHLTEHHPARIPWVERHTDIISQAIESPELVGRNLVYQPKFLQYRLELVCRIPYCTGKNNHVQVVISLPRTSGGNDAEICTIYPARECRFYTIDGNGNLLLKPDLIFAK